jgi:glutamine amidotransferase
MKIVIIDFDSGNVNSIINILKKIGYNSVVTSDLKLIEDADKLILPGVGSFDTGMNNLVRKDLINILNKKVLEDKTPILGICLGMQLMGIRSQEGSMDGLGWLDFESLRFDLKDNACNLKIPHMGWNYIDVNKNSILYKDMYDNPRFYFVHSYYFKETNENESQILTRTSYGHSFVSSIVKDNIFGVQFHPEKSHKFGMKLLDNFLSIQ